MPKLIVAALIVVGGMLVFRFIYEVPRQLRAIARAMEVSAAIAAVNGMQKKEDNDNESNR